MQKHIVVCIADENLAHALCDYGVYLSNTARLPLMFLHVIEPISSVEINLVGNLILGEKDELLNELTSEEEKESKIKIHEGRELLHAMKARALLQGTQEIVLKQYHGEFIETLLALKEDARLLLLGLHSSKSNAIGENIIEVIKNVHLPVLLINSPFVTPKKLLIDCNGSKETKMLLTDLSKYPLFGSVQREIVNISTDQETSQTILEEAKEIFAQNDIDVNTHAINGTPQDQLLKYFYDNDFDVLARGAFSQPLIKELLFGSVTKEVLAKMTKPLLLMK